MVWLPPVWLALFLLLLGAGLLTTTLLARLGGPSFRAPLGTFQTFWFGYAFCIAFLALYSLILPIRWPAIVTLSAVAIAGFWTARNAVVARLRAWRAQPRLALVMGLATLLVALVVAARAAQSVGWYDTHLYHLHVVKWARTFPAVPGIANLHYRLAYNNSIHLFAAFTDCFIRGRASHLALGFLTSVVTLQLVSCVLRPLHRLSRGRAAYALLTLPFVVSRIASNEIASLSSDLPLNLICIVVVLELLGLPGSTTPRRTHLTLALALALATVATTTKLGGAGVLVVTGVVALHALRARGFARATLLGFATLPGLVLLGYFARQAVMSGWLLFPAPIGNLHLPWSLPEAVTLDQFRWIQSWARMPGREPAEVLDQGMWHWFQPWFKRVHDSQELVLLALAGLIAIYRGGQIRTRQEPWHSAALAAAVASLVLWFRGAPDLRFGAGFFWILLAVLAAPLLARTLAEPTGRALSLALCLALMSWTGGLSVALPNPKYWLKLAPVHDTELRQVELSPGLKVNVPAGDNDRCGNAPLPCTPYPAQQRLRRPNDLGAGFLY